MACCALTSEKSKDLAEKYPSVYFGTGCHPSDINGLDDKEFERISALTSHPKCVAVGEIGLDYYWQPYDKEKQIDGFIRQLELAKYSKLPVSIHSRDATADMLKVLKDNADKLVYGGVMHCFSGSVETAKELLKLGLYISFAGPLTFKKAPKLQEAALLIPRDRLLIETDSPYLAPEPMRGRRNEPTHVRFVAEKIAALRCISVEEVAEAITHNAMNVYRIK
jgi:TatD DNase family protein